MGHARVKCSFVISTFNRPLHLACLLRSLQVQSESSFEVIVTDNAETESEREANMRVVQELQDPRFSYLAACQPDCYLSANLGAAKAKGEYLCFPSDDGYYAPNFLRTMLELSPAALIYCDCIYDGHGCHYQPLQVVPKLGSIDKGGFLLRRELFSDFAGPAGKDRPADGWLIEELVGAGIMHLKAPGYMWVHN
jgi:glycosyltransferase involved in cell wall biosynthesis